MGTTVEVQLVVEGADREAKASEYADDIVAEMIRLQSICSSVDASSEFSRWLSGAVPQPSEELTAVLTDAARWQRTSEGRFNPAVGALTKLWSEAAVIGVVPGQDQLDEVVERIAEPPWEIVESEVVLRRPNIRCSLNAFAKGWIVDRAIEFAMRRPDVRSVTVNAGGDLRRSGSDPLIVGIEDPLRPFDNEPPIAAISITNAALATSGSARKYFTVDGNRFSHVLDPRTGWPVEAVRSLSVVAPNAAEADVLATILGVEDPESALAEAEHQHLAVFIITADGEQLRSRLWESLEVNLS